MTRINYKSEQLTFSGYRSLPFISQYKPKQKSDNLTYVDHTPGTMFLDRQDLSAIQGSPYANSSNMFQAVVAGIVVAGIVATGVEVDLIRLNYSLSWM